MQDRHPLRFYIFLLSLFSLEAQTHFTLPQNVWRISYTARSVSSEWKGHDGKSGWKDYPYTFQGSEYRLTQILERETSVNLYNMEYGFTDKFSFFLNIPVFNSNHEISTWTSSGDSINTSLDSLLTYFYPKNKNSQGLGDIRLGFNLLLKGKPAWSGRGKYSVYGGIQVKMPFGERLRKFNNSHKDSAGVPVQFSQLPIGDGLTEWDLSLFGEFFKRFKGRLVNITWKVSTGFSSREIVHNPISFLWTDQTEADSISIMIGENVLHQKGLRLTGNIAGKLELWPERLFLSGGMEWQYRGRDQYFSENEAWDSWMASRINFDTKNTLVRQWVTLNVLNTDPLKKIGPVPFEFEAAVKWVVPLVTRNTFGETEIGFTLSSYFQAW